MTAKRQTALRKAFDRKGARVDFGPILDASAPNNRTHDDALEMKEFRAEYLSGSAAMDRHRFLAAKSATASKISYKDLREEYATLWAEMAIRNDKIDDADKIVARIVEFKNRYTAVESSSGVPWYVIALIHSLEASGRFDRHLHNGDPLTARTVHVPAGRPHSGSPPFSWEESAVDALNYDGLTGVSDWVVERIAYVFEKFNGWGYKKYHPDVKSPYLWSFSNHYVKGKYVGDGSWSPTAVSKQCGAMVILKRLEDGGHIVLTHADLSQAIADVGANFQRGLTAAPDDGYDTFPRVGAVAFSDRAWPVQTQLTDGPGIFGYYSSTNRWGTAATVAALYEVGRVWLLRHPSPHPRVPVGDISLRGGGDIDGHVSHETGRDVDFRPMRNDGKEGKVEWSDSNYSRALTQELIDIIYSNGVVKVMVVGFNDPNIQGCAWWKGHDNHFHVRFFFEDEEPGYPTLRLGASNSPPVREFQRRLNNWYKKTGSSISVAEDGDFGQNTLDAALAFQTALGLAADGEIGRQTWEASLGYIV